MMQRRTDWREESNSMASENPAIAQIEKKAPASVRAPHIIAIGGGKGGIGKTIISALLAIALARTGKRTVLIDADLGGANLNTVMGIYMPAKTLFDFFQRRVTTVSELLIDTSFPHLRLICGAPGSPGMANIRYWEKMKAIRHFRKIDADFVVLDLGAGMSFNEIDLFNTAETGIVVANPEPPSIQECYSFIKVALFRRLRKAFAGDELVMRVLSKSRDASHLKDTRLMQELINEISAVNAETGAQFADAVQQFSPCLFLNLVYHDREKVDGDALRIAVADLLGIRLTYLCHLPYNSVVQEVMQSSRPVELFEQDVSIRRTLQRVVETHFIGRR